MLSPNTFEWVAPDQGFGTPITSNQLLEQPPSRQGTV